MSFYNEPTWIGKNERRMIAMHTIREFVKIRSEKWTSKNEELEMIFRKYGSQVRQDAFDLIENLKLLNIDFISVGVSQFPEDGMLFYVLNKATYKHQKFAIRKEIVSWGKTINTDGFEVDFSVMNERIIGDRVYKTPTDIDTNIFRHKGYYVFSSNYENESSIQIVRLEDARKKFNAAFSLGLANYSDGEYGSLLEEIAINLGIKGWSPTPANGNKSPMWVTDFEKYVAGDGNLYVGGSINARLLKRLWVNNTGGRMVVLCEPSDFGKALNNNFPTNRVVFGHGFMRKIRKDKEEVIKNIADLLRSCGKMLHDCAVAARGGDTLAIAFIRDIMYELAPKVHDPKEKRWNFVVSEEDMINLIIKDNDFSSKPQLWEK